MLLWRVATQRHIGPLMVINPLPLRGKFLQFTQRLGNPPIFRGIQK